MTQRNLIRIVAVCVALAGPALSASSASANENARQGTTAQTTDTKPLKLRTFMRKPVASSATRTVKKKNGSYAKVAGKRHAKQTASPPSAAAPALAPAAAQALASYEVARVRVVTPETTGSAAILTDPTPAAVADPMDTIVDVQSVQVVNADEINDLDRKADSSSSTAVPPDALSRDLAGSGLRDFAAVVEPKPASESWYQRFIETISGAYTAVASLVRTLLA